MHKPQQSFAIAILLNANLFFVACHERPGDTTKNLDSSKTIHSTDFKGSNDTTIINQGKTLFVANCGTCHAILKTDNYLAGVVERVGVNYLKLYITKQDSLVKSKDKYALELKKIYGNLANNHNFPLSDVQLNAIISYLDKYSR